MNVLNKALVGLDAALASPRVRKRASSVSMMASIVLVLLGGAATVGAVRYAQNDQKLREQYVSSLSNSGAGMVAADKEGTIVAANKQAEELFGCPLVGKHVHSFCGPENRTRADAAFHAAIRRGGGAGLMTVRCTLPSKTGPRDVEMQIRPWREGTTTGVVATITPVDTIQAVDLTRAGE
jgi:PAS domain S-box-containing protein